MNSITAFILAGGRSSRMGRDKAFLELGGRLLIERAVAVANEVTKNVLIVGDRSKFAEFGAVIEDTFHEKGPLGGIHAALSASNSEWNLVLAVDLPFLDARFLKYLVAQAQASGATVAVPSSGNRFQPLCAVYRKQFAEPAGLALASGANKVDALFGKVDLRTISDEELKAEGFSPSMFRNLNTPEEWEQAKKDFTSD